MTEKTVQYIAIGVFALLLIVVGVMCFVKKDNFVKDPVLEGDIITPNQKLVNFFKSVGADPEHKLNDERYLLACQECNQSKPETTPSACSKCTAFMSGIRRHSQGVL